MVRHSIHINSVKKQSISWHYVFIVGKKDILRGNVNKMRKGYIGKEEVVSDVVRFAIL